MIEPVFNHTLTPYTFQSDAPIFNCMVIDFEDKLVLGNSEKMCKMYNDRFMGKMLRIPVDAEVTIVPLSTTI